MREGMMAKKDKDKIYYEVTREKPFGLFHMLLAGGSAGSVLCFLIVSLVGAYAGLGMDGLILLFLTATFLGFLLGAILVWFFIRFVEPKLDLAWLSGGTSSRPSVEEAPSQPIVEEAESPVVGDEEAKGKSVDFVFPELSPDKQ